MSPRWRVLALMTTAQAGASVLLADKATFPRDKPCGGESPRPVSVSVALGANHAKHFSFRKS